MEKNDNVLGCACGSRGTEGLETSYTFEELGLRSELLAAVKARAYDRPLEVQQLALVPLWRHNSDVAVRAHSGTGKTATLVLGVLQLLDVEVRQCQALIAAPSIETAQHAQSVIHELGEIMDVRTHVTDATVAVAEDVQVVIGTPRTMLEAVTGGCVRLELISLVFVDEADLLVPEDCAALQRVIGKLPSRVSVATFSVTDPECRLLQHEPVSSVVLEPRNVTFDRCKLLYVNCEHEEWKYEILNDINNHDVYATMSVIYCNTTRKADWLAAKLLVDGWPRVVVAHGAMSRARRQRAVRRIKSGIARHIVATDHLARDLFEWGRVIFNYDLPRSREDFILRTSNIPLHNVKWSVFLVTQEELDRLYEFEQSCNVTLTRLEEELYQPHRPGRDS